MSELSGRNANRNANLLIGSFPSGVWHREYWDRFMRDEAHYCRAAEYIRNNPVKAGLVERAEQWKWGSAYKEANREIGVPGSADQEIGVPIGVPALKKSLLYQAFAGEL